MCHTHPFQQGSYNTNAVSVQETRAAPLAQISSHIHSQDDAKNSGVTVMTKFRSDTNQFQSTFSPHSRHETHEPQMAAPGLFWNLHLQKAKCPQVLSTAEPRQCRWQCFISHLITGCSRICYLQGVQPGQFLALLCLLAVQGGQELPSHPGIKERVKSFVH